MSAQYQTPTQAQLNKLAFERNIRTFRVLVWVELSGLTISKEYRPKAYTYDEAQKQALTEAINEYPCAKCICLKQISMI